MRRLRSLPCLLRLGLCVVVHHADVRHAAILHVNRDKGGVGTEGFVVGDGDARLPSHTQTMLRYAQQHTAHTRHRATKWGSKTSCIIGLNCTLTPQRTCSLAPLLCMIRMQTGGAYRDLLHQQPTDMYIQAMHAQAAALFAPSDRDHRRTSTHQDGRRQALRGRAGREEHRCDGGKRHDAPHRDRCEALEFWRQPAPGHRIMWFRETLGTSGLLGATRLEIIIPQCLRKHCHRLTSYNYHGCRRKASKSGHAATTVLPTTGAGHLMILRCSTCGDGSLATRLEGMLGTLAYLW